MVWLNIDRFKDVNDALGQVVGDRLLRAVGERLREAVRSNDMVARAGGDDFLLLLPRIRSRHHVDSLMRRIHDAFEAPFTIDQQAIYLTASWGVAVHPNGGADARKLQENAHTAMRVVKNRGGKGCHVFEGGFGDESTDKVRLASEIREGLANGEFLLHYQPQIELASMRIVGLEALVRWQHPQRGLVPPFEFIPFAEESGLIEPLGSYVLREACTQMRAWHTGLDVQPRLAVNVSAREFQRTDVCAQVAAITGATGLAPEHLEIEITESAVLEDPARAAAVAERVREMGATIALDDFGTGYSSLTHLREFPIDRVKLDRSFIANCLNEPSAAAIIEAVTGLAHRLGLEVVAEGVENAKQLMFVKTAGCDIVQGYHFSPPLSADDSTEHLRKTTGAS